MAVPATTVAGGFSRLEGQDPLISSILRCRNGHLSRRAGADNHPVFKPVQRTQRAIAARPKGLDRIA